MSKSKEQRILRNINSENNETIKDMLHCIEHMEELIELKRKQLENCDEDLIKELTSDIVDLEYMIMVDKQHIKVLASRNDEILNKLTK